MSWPSADVMIQSLGPCLFVNPPHGILATGRKRRILKGLA